MILIELDAKKLSDKYIQWYKEQISFKNIKKNVVRIDLPFLDSFQDEIVLYAIQQPDGNIKLTDDGWTINNLEEHGVFINRSKHRKEILKRQLMVLKIMNLMNFLLWQTYLIFLKQSTVFYKPFSLLMTCLCSRLQIHLMYF